MPTETNLSKRDIFFKIGLKNETRTPAVEENNKLLEEQRRIDRSIRDRQFNAQKPRKTT